MRYWLLTISLLVLQPAARATTTRLHLDDEINEESVAPLLDGIANAPRGKDDRVILEINSPGGEVDSGFKLVKAIEAYPAKVVCIVDGEADSMASYLFVACDVRVMTKRSILMIHQPAMQSGGQQNDLQNSVDWLTATGSAMAEHYSLHMNLSTAEIMAKCTGDRELWMDWKAAKKYGAADFVVDRVGDFK